MKQVAVEAGIEVLQPQRPREPEFLDRLRALAAGLLSGGRVRRAGAPRRVGHPRHGWVNLHFSVLPAWRGAAPVQHAVLAGDEVTGASTFLLEEGMDTGPVYGVVTEEIRPRDTSGDVLKRLSVSGAALLVATLDGIEDGTLVARPQPADGVSMAPKITVEDVHVDWTAPAQRVDRLIRAATPAPGAWTTFRGKRVKLDPVSSARVGSAPGEVEDRGKAGVVVGTATNPVLLGTVRPEGKAAMDARDWARGIRPVPGDRFE